MLYGTYFFGMIPQLIYAQKTKITSLMSLLSTLSSFVIVFYFIKLWGVFGAGLGALFSGIILGVVNFIVSQKYYKIHWEYSKIFLILFYLFVPSIILILMRKFNILYEYKLIFKVFITFAYYYLGIKLNIIPKKIFNIIKNKISQII